MSGIAGVLGLRGATPRPGNLRTLTHAMKRKCPDGTWEWSSGPVALAYCHLSTTEELVASPQLATLVDPEIAAVLDGWIDNRGELARALAGGEPDHRVPTDADLVLRAYAKWGRDLVDHLVGDFAFAIWDGRRQSLLLGRDHFGVRPLYYRCSPDFIEFSSNLNSLADPVSCALREESVYDYLAFGFLLESDATIYADVQRLPPATTLLVMDGRTDRHVYWRVPDQIAGPMRSTRHYVEEFSAIFGTAVADRARGQRLAVELSGGMDCTSVAAIAVEHARIRLAQTISCGELDPRDQEAELAALVAQHLSIPHGIRFLPDYCLFQGTVGGNLNWPFPYPNPNPQVHQDLFMGILDSGSSLLLTGLGGDALFANRPGMPASLLHSNRWPTFFVEAARCFHHFRTLRGLGFRAAFTRAKTTARPWSPPELTWIQQDFARRVRAPDRWNAGWQRVGAAGGLTAQFSAPWVSDSFEAYEAPDLPVTARHPFFDTRLVEFLATAPAYASRDKLLLRLAMKEKLPSEIISRPKTSLPGDPGLARLQAGRLCPAVERSITPATELYFDWTALQGRFKASSKPSSLVSTWSTHHLLSPLGLATWMLDRSETETGASNG